MLGIGILAYYLLFGSEADARISTASRASATAVPATTTPSATAIAAETTTPTTSRVTTDATTLSQAASETASKIATQTGGGASLSSGESGISPSRQPKSTPQAAQTSSKGYAEIYTGKSTFYLVSRSLKLCCCCSRHLLTLKPISAQQHGNPGGKSCPDAACFDDMYCRAYETRMANTACGDVNPDEALICALQTKLYAKGKHCGRKIEITRTSGKGGQIVVTVADECPR